MTPDEIGRRMWVAGSASKEILAVLGLTTLAQFRHYRWRHAWPPRKPGRPFSLLVAPSAAQIAEGRVMWTQLASAKEIQEVLGLATTNQVYTVARREGWPKRARPQPVEAAFKHQVRAALATLPPLAPRPERKAAARRSEPLAAPAPDKHLPHVCAGCGYRAAPEHTVWVAEEPYHARCAGPVAA